MNRLRRWLFDALAGLSLLLLLATAALWVRSHWVEDRVSWLRDSSGPAWWIRRIAEFDSSNGGVRLRYIRSPATDDSDIKAFSDDAKIQPRLQNYQYPSHAYPRVDLTSPGSQKLGFGFSSGLVGLRNPPKVWEEQLVFPDWSAMLLFAIPCILWGRTTLRIRRDMRRGLCPQCGYDLRATPERCPECGTAVLKAERI